MAEIEPECANGLPILNLDRRISLDRYGVLEYGTDLADDFG